MEGICKHCRELIGSAFVTRPHHNLVSTGHGAEGELYVCQACDCCFEFTAEHIYLLKGDAARKARAAQTWQRPA
ncbi:hypothetical protein GCM10011348_18280 [Marinobacterium nitratireducens]|uniref:Uncharacterized protein n=1 Tax=Marinobacterium nitratireducens TaxID=518897 RepID=A0A917ZDH5_9GAMM|nr:hypothetical protein [Marinobacterium nitratireducens]GGO80791.1 hypothetical protein GCM10011348_18280 [Marinobacterium nitratireducens]